LFLLARILRFLIRIFHDFVHLNLVSDGRGWLRVLHVVHILLLLILLLHLLVLHIWTHLIWMNVIFTSSGSRAAWIWIYTSNPIIRVVCVLPHIIYTRPGLHILRRGALLFADIDGTSIVTSLAEAASFRPSAPISDVDVLRNCVGFQASLSLYRGK
jgi:hypothetical protein